jgi:hypothetical protein
MYLREGKPMPQALKTHFNWELAQANWSKVLDKQFIDAWVHGIVVTCHANGVKHCLFPQIFSYSMDYPKK